MQTYTIENLKKQFNQLKILNDLTLSPILDGLFHCWIDNIPNDFITDILKLPDNNIHFHDRDKSYICVFEGKIVKIDTFGINVERYYEDEQRYKYNRIQFKCDDDISKKLFEKFNNFIEGKNIEDLISMSSEKLVLSEGYYRSLYRKD